MQNLQSVKCGMPHWSSCAVTGITKSVQTARELQHFSNTFTEEFPMQKTDSLRQNDMMRHLMDAMERGQDIGHYGRLVFAMVARHFMADDELVAHLARNPGFSELQAKAL